MWEGSEGSAYFASKVVSKRKTLCMWTDVDTTDAVATVSFYYALFKANLHPETILSCYLNFITYFYGT